MVRTNKINCKCVRGIYKDQNIEIIINEDAIDCEIYSNGKELSGVQKVVITLEAGKRTSVNIDRIVQ